MRAPDSPRRNHVSRRGFISTVTTGLGAITVAPQIHAQAHDQAETHRPQSRSITPGKAFQMRACFEDLILHYWYRIGMITESGTGQMAGQIDDKKFWDKQEWERVLRSRSHEGYNAIIYGPSPNQWQTYLVRHKEFPEAREIPPEVQEPIIEHVKWIFAKAHEFQLKNLLNNWQIVTSPAFARAHGIDKVMPESAEVSRFHNLFMTTYPSESDPLGPHFGVRNALTRAFTEAVTTELLQIYRDLDGFYGEMGEALPGKRSTWYQEAIVPALKGSGRNPIYVLLNWMMPREDFIQDIAHPGVYQNTWLSIMPNGEMFTDAKPYPNYVQWAEESGVPCIMGIHVHNYEGGFPYNSPRLAYKMVKEFKKVENCVGFSAQLSDNPNDLFREGLGYYGGHLDEQYSDDRWVAILEERFGDRDAARHILNAYHISAEICPEVCAQFWHNTDIRQGRHLSLRYFFFTDQDPRYAGWYTSPSRGTELIPIRRYAQIVAKYGPRYRDNGGGDYTRPPYAQAMIMGPADYQTTPETQMRKIRQLGEECLREAELGRQTVKKNVPKAASIFNYMKGYKLLTDYYERKVLAGISALIYGFGGPSEEKLQAEKLADEAVTLYEEAIRFIWENIDEKKGNITSRWEGKNMTLPELLEYEKKERSQLASLFQWSTAAPSP